jgi:hypothetical protein
VFGPKSDVGTRIWGKLDNEEHKSSQETFPPGIIMAKKRKMIIQVRISDVVIGFVFVKRSP